MGTNKMRKTGNFSPLTKQEILKVRKTGNTKNLQFLGAPRIKEDSCGF